MTLIEMDTFQKRLILLATFVLVSVVSSIFLSTVITLILYAMLGGYQTLRLLVQTAPRDFTASIRLGKLYAELKRHMSADRTVVRMFETVVQNNPDKVAIVTKERTWTYREMNEYSNKVANCALEMGLKAGDEVALFMETRAEYVLIWLGLAKIGVVTALINHNLRSIPLAHCVSCINAKWLVFSWPLTSAVCEATALLQEQNKQPRLLSFGGDEDTLEGLDADIFDTLIDSSSSASVQHRGSINDSLIYIYTSGTTGLPKAAVIKHSRYITMGASVQHLMPIRPTDVMYLCLPLYHTAGGCLGLSQVLLYGITGVLVPKFSASRFWNECKNFNCTIAQYIGETCRYLLAQPEKPADRTHNVRLMFGNGLRPNLWTEFQERFKIADIREFYGSTEGNTNLVNLDNRVGAVGFIPTIATLLPGISRRICPVMLIRVDERTGEPLRDANGFCIRCKPGETGEIVGFILKKSMFKFEGYVNKEETKKKLYHNVCVKGDVAFASGDLLVMDHLGYLYFKDRTGDTFRWKGENVATSEVEGIVQKIAGLTDCLVYGVQIPGNEGRAGMAAILDPERKLDLDLFLKNAKNALPSYAVPMFIRLLTDVESTDTFKLKKIQLQQEEYDIQKVNDPIYFLDLTAQRYVPLNNNLYENIAQQQVRV